MILSSTAKQTVILEANAPEATAEAARLLVAGELVAFPTDTLYGVGASVSDAAAIQRLFQAKQRPLDKGIPILLAEAADVDQVATGVSELARSFMARYWPGPLTIVVRRHPELPPILAPGDTIAVRVPDHDLARRLIRAAGGAVAATSANLSGQRPALNAEEALEMRLITRVCADRDELYAEAKKLADQIAACPPLTVQGVKEVMLYSRDNGIAAGLQYVAQKNAAALPSEDVIEALTAFMEKRQPIFKGK